MFAFRASRKALSHWGIMEYGFVFVFWLLLTIVPYKIYGWGLLSLLLFPLMLVSIFALTQVINLICFGASVSTKPVLPKDNFPLEIIIPELGAFKLSAMFQDVYENAIDWCGGSVNLSLNTEGYETIEVLKKLAIQLAENKNTINTQVLAFLIAKLLPAINENPTEALEKELSAEEFIEAITLEAIEIYATGEYTFWFDDGYLLGEHAIQVNGSIPDGPMYLDTPG